MLRSSFPQRAVRPNLFPNFSLWLGAVGVLLSGTSLILTGVSSLALGIKIGICIMLLVMPNLFYVFLQYTIFIWKRFTQYDLLYDGYVSVVSNKEQLQENFLNFLKILIPAGFQIFEVTGIEWGNKSHLLVIACDQQVPIGSKLFVINVSTLNSLGQFEIVQATTGGYLARENRILDAVWWGYLHDQVSQFAHPRVLNTGAVLLH